MMIRKLKLALKCDNQNNCNNHLFQIGQMFASYTNEILRLFR